MSNKTPYATAYKLLTLGYSIIPSGTGKENKAPAVEWASRQTTPATEAELQDYEDSLHPRLWGIVTGAISGVVVFDADNAVARAIFESDGLQPHIVTPRGGGHFYFKYPGFPIKTCASLLPHLDVRADGGMVNATGHSKLGEYKTLTLPTPDAIYPWEKLPKVVLARVNRPSERTPTGEPIIITEGERNAGLTSIAGAMRRKGADQAAIEAALLTINQEQCKPPLPEPEVKRIAQSTSSYAPAPTQEKDSQRNGQRPDLKTLVEVKAQSVRWLWNPYIPLEKLTLLEGDPGVGKSWVTLAIIAAVSLGRGLPNQETPVHGPCLLASAEDGIADTIKPRLSAMGADTRIIQAIDGLFTLDNDGFQWLETAICNSDPLPVLVVIDPLVAYLSGDMDINKANQARYATARLAKIADNYSLAIVAVRHLTKGGSLKPIYRGLGSIDFVAATRSVLLAGEDPDMPQERAFVHIKSNLAPKGKPVGFEISDGNFYWLEHTELTEQRILGTTEGESSPLADAKELIQAALFNGATPATEVFAEARAKGLSVATLNRAKKEVGVVTYRDGESGKKGGGQWLWKMPEGD